MEGNLGAGKTTFTKAFGKALNIEGHISSPTFSIVNEYQGEIPLYHFDLYRIKGEDELFQIGFEEYFRRPGYKLIEWPEVAMNLIDEGYVILKFEVTGEVERQISVLLPE